MAKYVFVTGGVTSSLGKGITAASVGRILKARGMSVSILKLDPYINVDPGTMCPYQHGEVFVTDDGAETDLDLGHYERFIDENLTQLPTSRPDGSTRPSSPRSGAATTSAARSRSSRTSPTRSRSGSGGSPATGIRTSSSSRSAGPSATSSRCRSSRPSARCARTSGGRTCCTSTSHCPRARRHRRAKDQADPALGQGAARASASSRTSSSALRLCGPRRDREKIALFCDVAPRRSSRRRRPTRSTRSR